MNDSIISDCVSVLESAFTSSFAKATWVSLEDNLPNPEVETCLEKSQENRIKIFFPSGSVFLWNQSLSLPLHEAEINLVTRSSETLEMAGTTFKWG